MVSELPAKSIDYFESLVNMFTDTYLVYRDIRKSHEAKFRMIPHTKDKTLWIYLKRFWAELAEVEKFDDKLATMAFKQGLYVYSPFLRWQKKVWLRHLGRMLWHCRRSNGLD